MRVEEYSYYVNKRRQNVVWKHEYDVKLWHHKQRTPNANDQHMSLNEPHPMKIFCVRHWLNAFHFHCLRSILGVSWRDRIPNTTIWRELLLPIYYLSLEYIDYAGVAMCIQNGRWSASEGHLVWATTLCSPTCRSPQTPLQGRTKKRFKGTQHKYGTLGTIDTGACSLALPSTRQTSIFNSNVHHRLQLSLDTTGKAIEKEFWNKKFCALG